MKNHKLIFIIPFRNCFPYLKECAVSLINQDYENWVALFSDDKSFDYSEKAIPNHDKIFYHRNEERITALPNIHQAILRANPNPDDIICLLDGDDHLIGNDVMKLVNEMYQDNTLLTFGQYQYSNGNIGHCRPYQEEEFNRLREGSYWASHLKTFKYKLYLEMMNQDPELSCYKNKKSKYFTMTSDIALMTPLMEIAGFERVKFNPKPVYMYRLHSNNDHMTDFNLQKNIEQEILSKPKFKKGKLE